MAHQNERDELLAAWRALSGDPTAHEGWRTISLGGRGDVCAARRFPDNQEAVIFAFRDVAIPRPDQLPQGKGFIVSAIDNMSDSPNRRWVTLVRRSEGSPDVFTTMVLDVIESMRSSNATNQQAVFRLFLTRIRAWQDFMRRGTDTILGPSAEIGLFGELVILQRVIDEGAHPSLPIDAWEGPFEGIHDFVFGAGAVEVKTTIATSGFVARVDSIDQLDDATRQPLFLAAVSLRIADDGSSLPDTITKIRNVVGDDPSRAVFDSKLIHAGFLDATAEHYSRRFLCTDIRVLEITEQFPRVTRANIPSAVIALVYDLDIDKIPTTSMDLRNALYQLGAV